MIEIEGPDGVVYEFPEGTTDDVIRTAMAKQYGGPQQQAPKPEVLNGALGAGQLGIQQGITFGFGDEIMAGMMTPVEAIAGAFTGEDSGKGIVQRFSDSYDRSLERERGKLKAAQEQHPIATTVGNVAGGLATGGALSKGGVTLLNTAKPTMTNMMGRGALEGGAYGAVYGFGEGEGLDDRLNKARKGAVIGTVTGGALGAVGAHQAGRAAQEAVPDTEALKAASNALYREADNAGVVFKPESFKTAVDDIANTVAEAGIDATLHPRATAAMSRLAKATDEPLTLKQFDTLRRVVNGAAKSIEPDERRVASVMIDKLDDYLAKVDPSEVIKGDPRAANHAIGQARKLWAQAKKSELLDDIAEKVDNNTSMFSGSGRENAMRNAFRQLANNKKQMRQFSPAERAAIQLVVRGGKLENAARLIGKAAPTGAVSTGAGAGVGYLVGGPVGAVAVPAAGAVARTAATALTGRNVRAAEALIRNGGVAPELEALSGPQRVLMELLMKGTAPQSPRVGEIPELVGMSP